jgi:hypothetical protein
MPRKKRSKSKRERLPPQTLESLDSYFRNRGYQPDSLLEDPQDADKTYVKPLPNGSRLHIRVKKGRKYLNVDEHIDSSDPSRSPIGHLIGDVFLDEPTHKKYRINLRKKKKGKRR